MFKIICVTNRSLTEEDFLIRLEKISASGADGIILREKDMTETDYFRLLKRADGVCDIPLYAHSFPCAAFNAGIDKIHLPLPLLRGLTEDKKSRFRVIGASCHSIEEAQEAESLGCSYITAGHIFDTDCKKGLPGRGLSFLREVIKSVDIPVYAIGGIDEKNIASVISAGAEGVCLMSSLMKTADPEKYIKALREAAYEIQ